MPVARLVDLAADAIQSDLCLATAGERLSEEAMQVLLASCERRDTLNGHVLSLLAGPSVGALDLPRDVELSIDQCDFLASRLVNLRQLNASGETIFSESLRPFLESCTELEELSVVGTSVDNTLFHVGDEPETMLRCPRLSKVWLVSCADFSDPGVECLLAAAGPTLADLNLGVNPLVTEAVLPLIAASAPQLRALRLPNCGSLRYVSFEAINPSSLPLLSTLDLEGVPLDDTAADALVPLLQQLSDVTLHPSSDTQLAIYAGGMGSLRRLVVTSSAVGDVGLHAVAAAAAGLEEILLRETEVTSSSVAALARACPRLRKAQLLWCSELHDEGAVALAQSCPDLQVLAFRCCGLLSDVAVLAIAQHCHQLRTLVLARTMSISNEAVVALARGCPLMESIDLSWNFAVNDEGLEILIRSMPRLRVLMLQGCKSITMDKILPEMPVLLPDLKRLDVSYCDKVSDELLGRLNLVYPASRCLEIMYYHDSDNSDMVHY